MPRHSPYALVRLNFLYISYTLVLFELSEFLAELSLSRTFVQDYIDSCHCEKAFFSPFALLLEFVFHLSVKLYFPFRLERLIYLLRLFVLFCSFSTQKYFLLFDCQRSSASVSRCWSVWMDSNHRPRAYQARALAT